MELLQSWVGSIAAITMIMAAISAICPKNSAGRTALLCGSVMLTVVLISPFKSFDASVFAEYTDGLSSEIKKRSNVLIEENNILQRQIIERNLRAYILQRAGEKGISCDVKVRCTEDNLYWASVEMAEEWEKEKISELLETECGIPVSRQSFK